MVEEKMSEMAEGMKVEQEKDIANLEKTDPNVKKALDWNRMVLSQMREFGAEEKVISFQSHLISNFILLIYAKGYRITKTK